MKRPLVTLALHAGTLFFLTLLMSGNANVLPQLFFQNYYPDRKVLLLAVALLLSTLASTAGVLASRRRKASRGAVLAGLTALLAAMIALFSATWHVAYIAITVLVQFSDNFLVNQLDHAAVTRVEAGHRRLNDVMGNIARLLGMLVAPAFFPAFYGDRNVLLAGVGLAGFIAIAGAANLLSPGKVDGAVNDAAVPESAPLDRADQLLLGYAVSIYAALYLFAANMIYLLRDLLQYPDPAVRGGRALVVVFTCALAANAGIAALRRGSPPSTGRRVRWLPVAAPAVALIIVATLLATGVRSSFAIFLIGSGAVGAAHGSFLLEVREYASRAAQQEGKSGLLTWFNNTANASALVAFTLMVFLASMHARYVWTLWLIALLPALGLALLLAARRRLGRIQE